MKKKPKLTDAEREKIHKDYSLKRLEDIDFQIALALDHDAAKKAGNSGSWNLYVRNWLNRWVGTAKPIESGYDKYKRDADRLNARPVMR